jgi:metal-sulfur cluster biosynthetic enzyme
MTVRELVLEALNTIVDPCSVAGGAPAGIADMGLIRALDVVEGEGGAAVSLTIGVTEVGCLMAAPFAVEAEKRVAALPGIASVSVGLDDKFDWDPADMAPAYRAHLQERHRLARERMLPLLPVTTARD